MSQTLSGPLPHPDPHHASRPLPGSTVARPPQSRRTRRLTVAGLGLLVLSLPLQAAVVINEVMYHPPNDRDELQWVELWNPGPDTADLTGWSFGKGLQFTFPAKTVLPPNRFLVVARDRVAFRSAYGTNGPVLGDFNGHLSHGGETIELLDASKRSVDKIRYRDSDPWPKSPDGLSSSLERISALSDGSLPESWAPSPLPPSRVAAGTPAQPNASHRTNLPPVLGAVEFTAPAANQPMPVSAVIQDPDGLRQATLIYQSLTAVPARPGAAPQPSAENEVPMAPNGDRYAASVPAQPDGTVVRFRIRAVDRTGSERITPHPHDVRPTWTVYVGRNPNETLVPAVSLLQLGPPEQPGRNLQAEFNPGRRRGRAGVPGEPTRGGSVVLYHPPGGGPTRIFDHVRITPRNGGWKIRLHRDQPLDGMSTVNVVFEYQPRFVLSEHLAYETFRAAGCPAPLSGHWRIFMNGRPFGYHLFVEQINASFLRRNQREDQGDLYKLLWYGRDLVGQHEKKNHPESGHAQLVDTLESLKETDGAEQWKIIQQRFNVENFINYFAVNMCIQNWDGFFNNYFVFRTPGAEGKWEIFPWDEDKTWGDYDGSSPNYDWYSMPLTFGMNGDQPPRGGFGNIGGIHGGPSWWRNPGWFSGPLLANLEFRTRFLARLREICEKTFTPEAMEPAIADLERKLAPEVRFRATAVTRGNPVVANGWTSPGEFPSPDADAASKQFKRHIDSFRNQVRHRREFLLRELNKAGARAR